MSRRVIRSMKNASTTKATSIITFFNPNFSQSLTNPTDYMILAQTGPKTHKKFDILRKTASQLGCVSLSANQTAYTSRFFTIHKNPLPQKWYNQAYNNYEDYRVYINPVITQVSQKDIKTQQEECASFPFLKFQVPRYQVIKIQYKTSNKQVKQEQMSGFLSRVFQQNIDTVRGRMIFNWRVNFGDIKINQQVHKHFPKSLQWVQEYCQKVKQTLKQYPQLKKITTLQQINNDSWNRQILSFQQDYHLKVGKHFQKQFALFNMKIQQGIIKPQDFAQNKKNNKK